VSVTGLVLNPTDFDLLAATCNEQTTVNNSNNYNFSCVKYFKQTDQLYVVHSKF